MTAILSGAAAALALTASIVLIGGAWEGTDTPMPDPAHTPGAIASTDKAEICGHAGGLTYSQRHRQTTIEMKAIVADWYQLPRDKWHGVEFDHRVPLSIGGADDTANLWPQPLDGEWGAHTKDKLEVFAWKQLCFAGASPAEVQAWFLGDWRAAYCQNLGCR